MNYEKLSYDDISDLVAWLLEAAAPAITMQRDYKGTIRVIFLDTKMKTTETIYWSFKDEPTTT